MFVTLEAAAIVYGHSYDSLRVCIEAWSQHMVRADPAFLGMRTQVRSRRGAALLAVVLYDSEQIEHAVAFGAATALGYVP